MITGTCILYEHKKYMSELYTGMSYKRFWFIYFHQLYCQNLKYYTGLVSFFSEDVYLFDYNISCRKGRLDLQLIKGRQLTDFY